MVEGLASDAIWSTGAAIAGKLRKKDLLRLFKESLQEAIELSSVGYDEVRKRDTRQITKALASSKLDTRLSKYAKPSIIAESTTEDFVKEVSRELAELINDKVDLSQEDLQSYLKDGMRHFQDSLIAAVAKDQELSGYVQLKLGLDLGAGLRSLREQLVSPFAPFTILPITGLSKVEQILRYNPPGMKIQGFVAREEMNSDPVGRKILLIGKPGSGKTTVIMRLLGRIKRGNVLTIHRSFSSEKVDYLANCIPKVAPLILVWDDLHLFRDEPVAVRRVVYGLMETCNDLTMIFAARSTEFEALRNKMAQDFWSNFEHEKLEDLSIDQISQLVGICMDELDVKIADQVKADLVLRIHSTDPTPFYVVSLMKSFKGKEIFEKDIHDIPLDALSLWAEVFNGLDANEQNLLRTLKLIDSAHLPFIYSLVSQIYELVLRGDASRFQSTIDRLADKGWIRETGDSCDCHDLQLEAVRLSDYHYSSLGYLAEKLVLPDRPKSMTLFQFGVLAQERGMYSDAKHLYDSAHQNFEKLGEQSGIAATLYELARMEYRRGNREKASGLYHQSNDLFETLGDQSGIARNLYGMALIEQEGGRYDEASKLCARSLEIDSKLQNLHGMARTLNLLASMRYLGGSQDEASRLYNVSLEIARRARNQQLTMSSMHNLAIVEQDKGNYDEASRLNKESLEIARRLQDQSGIAKGLHGLASIEQDRGNYGEASRLYSESLGIKRQLGDQFGMVNTLEQLAIVECERGEYDAAERLQKQSLEIQRRPGDSSGLSRAVRGLATIIQKRGNYDDAERLYNESLEISRRLQDQSEISDTLGNLGLLMETKGNEIEAEAFFNECLEIKRRLGDQSGIAGTLHNLASMELVRGNDDEAKRLCNESLTIRRKLGGQSEIAALLHQIAIIEQQKGNRDEAEKLYNESLEIEKKLGDQSGMASTLHNLGIIEQDKANYDEASRLYNESLTIKRKFGDQSGIASTLGELGSLSEQKGDVGLAEKYYQQALEIFERLGEKPYIDLAKESLERIRKLKQKP